MSSQAASQQRSSSAFEAIRPVVVLVAICMVAGVLLGVVHMVTDPIATANAEKKAQETYAQLVPTAATFDPVECSVEGCTAALEAHDAQGQLVAHVIVAQSKGYGGQVPIAVAFGPDGKVLSITTMANEETPGLGTKIANDSYIGQYVGLGAESITADDIDLISGATISSKAALSAFNIAVEAYEEVQ
jgi:RnfABCDGE-type electron transport complex G subunit